MDDEEFTERTERSPDEAKLIEEYRAQKAEILAMNERVQAKMQQLQTMAEQTVKIKRLIKRN